MGPINGPAAFQPGGSNFLLHFSLIFLPLSHFSYAVSAVWIFFLTLFHYLLFVFSLYFLHKSLPIFIFFNFFFFIFLQFCLILKLSLSFQRSIFLFYCSSVCSSYIFFIFYLFSLSDSFIKVLSIFIFFNFFFFIFF